MMVYRPIREKHPCEHNRVSWARHQRYERDQEIVRSNRMWQDLGHKRADEIRIALGIKGMKVSNAEIKARQYEMNKQAKEKAAGPQPLDVREHRDGAFTLKIECSGGVTVPLGYVIATIDFTPERLIILGSEGRGIKFWDDGRNCCETRYMSCDDDLTHFAGAVIIGAEVRDMDDAAPADDWGQKHEQACLVIQTSKGDFTVVTHNEHNGYYSGFVLRTVPVSRAGIGCW